MKCKTCGVKKAKSEFYIRQDIKKGIKSSCKECNKNKSLVWTWRKHKILNSNGLPFSLKDREEISIKQKGNCALCGRDEKGFSHRLSLDHDHKSGRARGLLCWGCNSYNVAKNTYETALKVVQYLKEYK